MKLRQGFVSNSSSSSFMVAVKKGKEPSGVITITKKINLNQYASDVLSTAEDVLEYFVENHDTRDNWDKETITEYKKALSAVANGMHVLVGSFDDQSGDLDEWLLCMEGLNSVKSSNINVIHSEAGY